MAEPVTLARPYAKAAFQTALADNQLMQWEAMLDVLGRVVLHDKVLAALSNPSLTAGKQAVVLFDVCASELSDKGKNFVELLADYKRLGLLPEIATQFKMLKTAHEKVTAVSVTSAFEMNAAESSRLASVLSVKWNCKIDLQTQVDKSLLGGVVIRAGDTVIDASVRGRIQKLTEVLGI